MAAAGVALVTGASRGIGRALAERLARHRLQVIAVARGREALEETVAACGRAGGQAEAYPADITQEGEPERLARAVGDRYGRLDVLVQNAGAYHHGPLEAMPAEALRRIVALNVGAPLAVAAACTPLLAETARRFGLARLVQLASVAGHEGIAGEAAYAASKHAAVGLGRAAFAELRGRGVAVTVLSPGLVATDMAAGRGARRDLALRPEDIAEALSYVLACRPGACPTEIVLQPQHDPFSAGA